MYKMITIDVDDTLLNDDHQITGATKAAIVEARNQGVIITLATGRMFASAKQIASQLDMNVPLITYQGSLVKTALEEEILYERTVPIDAAKFIFEYADKNRLHLQAYSQDRLYVKEENTRVRQYSEVSMVPFNIYPNFLSLSDQPLSKLLFFEEPDVITQLEKELRDKLGDAIYLTKSKPFFLEILHKEGTKGHAVKFLAERFDCDLSQVIAIGDSWNDHEMIQTAGLGVAMENAVDSLKKMADYVTRSNNENGVKHVIDQFVLNKKKQ